MCLRMVAFKCPKLRLILVFILENRVAMYAALSAALFPRILKWLGVHVNVVDLEFLPGWS